MSSAKEKTMNTMNTKITVTLTVKQLDHINRIVEEYLDMGGHGSAAVFKDLRPESEADARTRSLGACARALEGLSVDMADSEADVAQLQNIAGHACRLLGVKTPRELLDLISRGYEDLFEAPDSFPHDKIRALNMIGYVREQLRTLARGR